MFAIPGVDQAANTTEFFVHHEDVRRAGELPRPARALDPAIEDWVWRRLKVLARPFSAAPRSAMVLERLDDPAAMARAGRPQSIRAMSGSSIVTLVGAPSELLMFANGRTGAAEVKIIGEPDAIDILHSADLHV